MKIPEMKGACPHCGKKMPWRVKGVDVYFESPIKICGECKGVCLDKRCHEIEVEGMDTALALLVKRDAIWIVGGIFSVILFFLINYMMLRSGTVYLKLAAICVVMQLVGIIMVVYSVIEMLLCITGIKRKQLEKKRLESQRRLEDREYAKLLLENGYFVPKKYTES